MTSKLLLATSNRGKAREFHELLGSGFELLTLRDIDPNINIPEPGATYEENASIKALVGARLSGILTLADDSGLEVDALGGQPGTMSARYAGDKATDAERVAYLLSKLKDVPQEKRSARFVCVIAIAVQGGSLEICRGECEGRITFESRGDNGFGYDPIFFFPEYGKTMAELPSDLKNKVSHRARAAQKALVILRGRGLEGAGTTL
jgi:XTP/dITP diphosphohydrolase